MVVGEDVTLGADDDTAAQSGLGLRGLVTKEELEPGVVAARVAHGLAGIDADHGGRCFARCAAETARRRLPRRGWWRFNQGHARTRAGGALADPVGLEGGDNKIGRGENRHGLREQQPDAFHDE